MTYAIPVTPACKSGPEPGFSLLGSKHFIWFIALLLSLAVHAVLFFQKNTQLNALPSMVIQETITHVRFASVAPPPITVIEPKIEIPKPEPVIIQQKVVEKIVEEQKPDPVSKPEAIKKKTIAKPKKKKKLLPKPKKHPKKKPTRQKPPVKIAKPPLKEQPTSFNSKPQVNKELKVSPLASRADQRLIEQTRKSYHALLMRHIEVHKHYPRVARKRKIEGKILVTFTLLANGSIKNLHINGKKSILEKSTKNAINNALPMPKPPNGLSLPLEIKFNMNYFLK